MTSHTEHNIIDYISRVNPRLCGLLKNACVDDELSQQGSSCGMTFVIPHESLISTIENLLNSGDNADMENACKILNSMIIKVCLKSGADWNRYRADIPNSIYPRQHIEIAQVRGDTVTLKNGAVLELDKGFTSSHCLSVWKLISGEIGTNNPLSSGDTIKAIKTGGRKKRATKKGSYEVTAQEIRSNIRFQIGVYVENLYAVHLLKSKRHGSNLAGDNKDPYLDAALSLLMFLRHRDSVTYMSLLPMVSFQKIDFYLLVEPHNFGTHGMDPLIDDSLIAEWWNSKATVSISESINTILEDLKNGDQCCLSLSNRAALSSLVKNIRKNIIGEMKQSVYTCVETIAKYYNELSTENALSGVGPIFPYLLAHRYEEHPGLKMFEDELRYVVSHMFEQLEADSVASIDNFRNIVNTVAKYANPSAYKNGLIMNPALFKSAGTLDKDVKFKEICILVNSTNFMYFAMTREEYQKLSRKYVTEKPEGSRSALYNIGEKVALQHERLFIDGKHNNDTNIDEYLMSMIKSRAPADMSAELVNLMRKYVRAAEK